MLSGSHYKPIEIAYYHTCGVSSLAVPKREERCSYSLARYYYARLIAFS